MKIYLDVIFLLNFMFDFLLLLTVKIILRRNIKLSKIIYGAFLGALSIFALFLPMTSLLLFIFKIVISIIMLLVTFGYRNFLYTARNFLYLYTVSMVLGGVLYYLNTEFSYKQEGLVFYHNGLSINFIFLVLTSPIIVYIYIKQGLYLKNNYSKYYSMTLFNKSHNYKLNGFLDTGNVMVDPYFNRPIILIDKRKFVYDINEFKMFLIPIDSANAHSLLTCIKLDKLYIDKIGYRYNVLLGLMDNMIYIDGIDIVISEKLLEE